MKSKGNDVMVDLETMGVASDAAIIAIGAVIFTDRITKRFYRAVSLESSISAGASVTAATILFWVQQTGEARAVFTGPSMPLRQALTEFAGWLPEGARVWGNGAAFDNVILRNAYQKVNMHPPWDWRNDRCFRTVSALHSDVPFVGKGGHHNALDDAESQARHMIKINAERRNAYERHYGPSS